MLTGQKRKKKEKKKKNISVYRVAAQLKRHLAAATIQQTEDDNSFHWIQNN